MWVRVQRPVEPRAQRSEIGSILAGFAFVDQLAGLIDPFGFGLHFSARWQFDSVRNRDSIRVIYDNKIQLLR